MVYVSIACRCLIGCVFLCSLVAKVRSGRAYGDFVASARELTGTSSQTATMLAVTAIAVEILVVALLAVPGAAAAGLAVAAALLATYSVALARALSRGLRIPCRCLGARAEPISPALLGRNAVLLLITGLGLVAGPLPPTPVEPIPVGVSVLAAALGTLLVVFFEDLAFVMSTGQKERKL